MFQTFWNVAAAFCAHEQTTAKVAYHFGHHVAMDDSGHSHAFKPTQSSTAIFQDHHDHLPTCLHVLTTARQQQAEEPLRVGQLIQQRYRWSNSYQSPHLFNPDPPPVLALL